MYLPANSVRAVFDDGPAGGDPAKLAEAFGGFAEPVPTGADDDGLLACADNPPWSGRPDLNRRPPAPKLAHCERLAKPCFCRSSSSGSRNIRVS
jgi:hypothetical protein